MFNIDLKPTNHNFFQHSFLANASKGNQENKTKGIDFQLTSAQIDEIIKQIFDKLEDSSSSYFVDPKIYTNSPLEKLKEQLNIKTSSYYIFLSQKISDYYSKYTFNTIDNFANIVQKFIIFYDLSNISAWDPTIRDSLFDLGINEVLKVIISDFEQRVNKFLSEKDSDDETIIIAINQLQSSINQYFLDHNVRLSNVLTVENTPDIENMVLNMNYTNSVKYHIPELYRSYLGITNNVINFNMTKDQYIQNIITNIGNILNEDHFDQTKILSHFKVLINGLILKSHADEIRSNVNSTIAEIQADNLIDNPTIATFNTIFPSMPKVMDKLRIEYDQVSFSITDIQKDAINKTLSLNLKMTDVDGNEYDVPFANIKYETKAILLPEAEEQITDFLVNAQWKIPNKISLGRVWSESEMVEWISIFSSTQDILNIVDQPQRELLLDDINNLLIEQFPTLVDAKYNRVLKYKFFVKIVKKTGMKIGELSISFEMTEEKTDGTFIDKQTIEIKYPTKIYSAIEVIAAQMKNSRNDVIVFDSSRMFIEQFLNNQNNLIGLVVQRDALFDNQNNIDEITENAQQFIYAYFHNYRIQSVPKITTSVAIQNESLVIVFTIHDAVYNESFVIRKIISIGDLKNIAPIKNGTFKKDNGDQQNALKNYLDGVTPLKSQSTPNIGDTLDPLVFQVRLPDKNPSTLSMLFSIIEKNTGYKFDSMGKVVAKDLDVGIYVTFKHPYVYFGGNSPDPLYSSFTYFIDLNETYVTPQEISDKREDILTNLPDRLKTSVLAKDLIENTFNEFRKTSIPYDYRDDISKVEFNNRIERLEYELSQITQDASVLDMLKKIYGENLPDWLTEYINDPQKFNLLKQLAKEFNDGNADQIKAIIENKELVKALVSWTNQDMINAILKFIEVSKHTKYTYMGLGIGAAAIAAISGVASIRQLRINRQVKKTSIGLKPNRLLSSLMAITSIVAIAASSALLFIFFFIERGI